MKIPILSCQWLALAVTFTAVTSGSILFNTTAFTNPGISLSAGKKATCITGSLPITVSVNNTHLLTSGPANDFETTELFIKYTQANSTSIADLTGNITLVTGTFNIFSKLCFPSSVVKDVSMNNLNESTFKVVNFPKTVHILTHGGTLDIDYWDLAAPNNSYVDAAAVAGYATFSYARLGTSPSSQPDPIQIVQMSIQVEILHHLTLKLRSSELGGSAFQNVVGIGHSIGAGLSQGIATKYPADWDAIVLSGHSTSFADATVGSIGTSMQIANLDPSGRFQGLANGYFILGGGLSAHQFSFYKYPHFDIGLFNSQVATSQCNLLGELWTLPSVYVPAPSFTGPVDIVDGDSDFFYCRGDCTFPTNQAELALSTFYPAASNGSQTFLVPNSGHNVNAHFNAPLAFSQIINFLYSNGIF